MRVHYTEFERDMTINLGLKYEPCMGTNIQHYLSQNPAYKLILETSESLLLFKLILDWQTS